LRSTPPIPKGVASQGGGKEKEKVAEQAGTPLSTFDKEKRMGMEEEGKLSGKTEVVL